MINKENMLFSLKQYLSIEYTPEQQEFISSFNDNAICFANPGTGKTQTVIGGLLFAELFHKIPGKHIYASSFTNAATDEIKLRHEYACNRLMIQQRVNFKTVDALCKRALELGHKKLGFEKLEISKQRSSVEEGQYLLTLAEDLDIFLDITKIGTIVSAINKLNSNLIFDREHVEDSPDFKMTRLSFQDFTALRKKMYELDRLLGTVQVQNIPLFTLELFQDNPEVSEYWKKEIQLMVVDEFQDMSSLKLQLLSFFTNKLIVVGDMKQQIYGFTGASSKIVNEYKAAFPDHKEFVLNKSFRCKEEIVEYAKKLIKANKLQEESFEGAGAGGKVVIGRSSKILSDIIEQAVKDLQDNTGKDYLFLYRNNASTAWITEYLWKHNIRMRMPKYVKIIDLPVIKDIYEIINAIDVDKSDKAILTFSKYIPQFRKFISEPRKNPLLQIYKQHGLGLSEMNFNFGNGQTTIINEMIKTTKMHLEENKSFLELIQDVYPFYLEVYLGNQQYFMNPGPDFYIDQVRDIVMNKNFETMVRDEFTKENFIKESTERRLGYRVSTMHGAKGLEAEAVVVIDANLGIVPNESILKKYEGLGTYYKAAEDIRNERCLAFVSATRAKEELYVLYSSSDLSPLFDTSRDSYTHYDDIYKNFNRVYKDDVGFRNFRSEW